MTIQLPDKMRTSKESGRKTVIYAWLCPDTNNPVYVGKTSCTLADRMRSHKREALKKASTPKHLWLREMLLNGKQVKLLELEICGVTESSEREQYWIEVMRRNYSLLNLAAGGCGNPGIGRVFWTDEIIALLGKTTDRAIALLIGCDSATVSYRRKVLGIERFPDPHIVPSEIKLAEYIINRLGTEPDYKLAKEIGCSKFVIAKHRKRRGIKSYAETTGNNGTIRAGEPHRRWCK